MKNPDKMSSNELRNEVKEFRHLLALSGGLKCPNCDDVGFTVVQNTSRFDEEDWAQVQCEFCYTINASVYLRNNPEMTATEVRLRTEAIKPLPDFIFTVPNRQTSPQMCYREEMPHTAMDRWTRCHLVGGLVILGPAKAESI